jgi:hypothetical protein
MAVTPILIVMAAGIGSRFGGLKQLAPFGPGGEGLIDYSLYDARQAGFTRVIFIVNSRIKDDFRQLIGRHAESLMETQYACQELDCLPCGYAVPERRVKPWGTAHAVMCAEKLIDAPFCVINGDDLYGRGALAAMHAYLSAAPSPYRYAMAGFALGNTLSECGSVARGVCEVMDGMLISVTERTHIITTCDGPLYAVDNATYRKLSPDTIVSMNLWGFTPDFSGELAAHFPAFYQSAMDGRELTAEYYLPSVVGSLLAEGKARVSVLPSDGLWYGVTNASDRACVEQAIASMIARDVYPRQLRP